jgi:hypothetical protein
MVKKIVKIPFFKHMALVRLFVRLILAASLANTLNSRLCFSLSLRTFLSDNHLEGSSIKRYSAVAEAMSNLGGVRSGYVCFFPKKSYV